MAKTGVNRLTKRFLSYDQMYSYEMRLQSFKDWPFREECKCTPEKMAMAGFVHCPSENEPDVSCCFFCLIELEGWEPDDVPWSEHIKRTPDCAFLSMKEDFSKITVCDYYKMEKERLRVYIRKACNQKIAYLRDDMDKTLVNLRSLA